MYTGWVWSGVTPPPCRLEYAVTVLWCPFTMRRDRKWRMLNFSSLKKVVGAVFVLFCNIRVDHGALIHACLSTVRYIRLF